MGGLLDVLGRLPPPPRQQSAQRATAMPPFDRGKDQPSVVRLSAKSRQRRRDERTVPVRKEGVDHGPVVAVREARAGQAWTVWLIPSGRVPSPINLPRGC